MLRFFTQRSRRNIKFLTLRFFHFSIWQGALTVAFSLTSVNLPLFCFSLGGALTFAFSRSVVRSLAGPRARSLARLAARPLARPLARPEVARPPARASARPLARPLARLCVHGVVAVSKEGVYHCHFYSHLFRGRIQGLRFLGAPPANFENLICW